MSTGITVSFGLTSGVGSVTLPAPPPDIDAPVNVPGVTHRTQGGSLVQYQVGPAWFEATLNITAMINAQASALNAFFLDNWGREFSYRDANGNDFTARFLDQQLPLHKAYGDFWECRIHLQLSAVLK